MIRILRTLLIAFILLGAVPALLLVTAVPAMAQVDQQQTVNSALATLERMKSDSNIKGEFLPQLAKARAVLVVPDLYKGGFIVGAQYGNGVLLIRQKDGSFGYPGFYSLAGGSLGLQAGAEDISVVLLVMTNSGLDAVLRNQFTFGGNAGITVAVIGAGVGAGSTTAMGSDVMVFAMGAVGLYGGVSFEGAALSPHDSWNTAYYGHAATPRAIMISGAASNPQADRLRDLLAH